MTLLNSPSAPNLLQEYYAILTGGLSSYADGATLRPLLSEHLDFTGSLAGHVPDATEGFLQGVAGFIGAVSAIAVRREVHDAQGSAVLYDATLPGGIVRMTEFFTFAGGVISTLDLQYEGQDYLDKGGR